MPATTFPRFSSLCKELRDAIWLEVASMQYQDIADSLPHFSSKSVPATDALSRTSSNGSDPPDGWKSPRASDGALSERRQQAFVSYDNLPPDIDLQPLRLYVRNSPDNKMCIGANEAFSLGDCLPMSAVCHEARSHASHFCRSQMQFIDVHFSNDDNPGEHRDVQNEADTLHLVNMQPTTVIMTKTTIYDEPYDQPTINLFQFASAAHLVDAVTELFGNGVERLILNVWAGSLDAIDTMYWPHIELPKAGKTLWRPHWNLTIIKDSNHDPSKVFLAPDRNFHAVRDMFREHDERLRVLTWHLLKYHEILVAAAEKLPRLGTIETQLHSRSWWKYYPTRVKATVKDGALWTDWNDVEIFNYHDWTHKDAEMVYSVEEDLEYLDYADSPYSAASSQYSDFGDPSYSPMSLQYPDKDNIPYTPQPQEHSLPTSSDSH